MKSYRVLVADDNAEVRQGILTLLSSQSEFTVCGEAVDGFDAVEKAKELRPDIVLMNISMPRMDGLQATRILKRDVPECDGTTIIATVPISEDRSSAKDKYPVRTLEATG